MTARIKTEYCRKPGPTNKHDWLAFYEGDEPNDAGCMDHGEGATETQAIADLIDNHPRCNHWPGQQRCDVCGMKEGLTP